MYYKSSRNINNSDREKFEELGRAYMTEYSRFHYKIDAIVNDAQIYITNLTNKNQ